MSTLSSSGCPLSEYIVAHRSRSYDFAPLRASSSNRTQPEADDGPRQAELLGVQL